MATDQRLSEHYDVAIIGGGISGLSTAARLQAAGRSTIVLEAHAIPGGCAGFFRRKRFAFDVGATTLVDFEPGGVGGELLASIGMSQPAGETIPGYRAWLPDRTIDLYRDTERWHAERLAVLGDTPAHRRFWRLIDSLADVFWNASRRGISLPIRKPIDALQAARIIAPRDWPLARHLFTSVGDALRSHGLRDDKPLVGLLSMMIEDTVHARIDDAPLINAALGVTMRGAGLARAAGGMSGFMTALVDHYSHLGGRFLPNCEVSRIGKRRGKFSVESRKGEVLANQVVSAVPASTAAGLAPELIGSRLKRFLYRDVQSMGGGFVVFLGVPDSEVADHDWTHHQILVDYDQPLGMGNNMFVSVSAAGDTLSAPPGHRAVMVSTHCELSDWDNLSTGAYEARKAVATQQLVEYARRVYPRLATNPVVFESATPRTYARYARRPFGAVGGVRQTLHNSNQCAIPHDIGVRGFHLVGDSTWPGLGTVACVLGSRIVASNILGRREHACAAVTDDLVLGSR